MIGFACKFCDDDKQKVNDLNIKTTTQKFLRSNDPHQKIKTLLNHNYFATLNLLKYVSNLPKDLKMVRLSSDLLPFYTHNEFKNIYQKEDINNLTKTFLNHIGRFSRKHNIKLSFHPGQFTALSSHRNDVIQSSISECNYHAFMCLNMGFKTFNNIKINVHVSGKNGINGFRETLKEIPQKTKNFMTVENTENKYNLDTILELSDDLPIVFDIHHEFCNSGKYIDRKDKRISKVLKSWKGFKPSMHLSNSKGNKNRNELRSHSDFIYNEDSKNIMFDYLNDFDIMIEAKKKNLASIKFYNDMKKINIGE